jgi:hypothetical protein
MSASRSDVMVRTKMKSWIAAASFLVLLVAAFLMASIAHAASTPAKSRTKATADTVSRSSDDEGISVKVVDGGRTRAEKRRLVHKETSGDETADTPDTPDAPDAPEPPEPPDHDNDLVRFGQDIEIEQGKVVEGSVVAIGGNIEVHGSVKGDCTAVGGSVTVDSTGVVNGDAVSVGGSTTLVPGGKILGSNVSVGTGTSILHRHGFLPFLGLMGVGAAVAGVMSTVVQLLITLLLAWLALLLIRERMVFAVDRMATHFGKSLLWGLVAWIGAIVAIPTIVIVGAIAMVILVITIIGIPVAILLLIAMIFALIGAALGIIILVFLGYVNGCMYLGRLVLHRRTPGALVSPMKAVIVGSVLILGIKILGNMIGFMGLVFLMPIGIAMGIAAAVLCAVLTTSGMGALVLTRLGKGPSTWSGATSTGPAGAAGWYSPPTPPPPSTPQPAAAPQPPQPEGGSSDAP